MDYSHAIVKAVVQGLTEFLPVSSSAHLVFTDGLSRQFHLTQTGSPLEEEFYDVMLHLGTLAAVSWYYRRELIQMAMAILWRDHRAVDRQTGWPYTRMAVCLVVSFACTSILSLAVIKGSEPVFAAMGWATDHVHDLSEFYLQNPQFVACNLLLTGALLTLSEVLLKKRGLLYHPSNRPQPLGLKQAVMIGTFQGCSAIFRGLSRSGSTITAGVLSGQDRSAAARYSFLLSIPTYLAVAVYEGLKALKAGGLATFDWPAMIVGTMVSAVVGYLCVAAFLKFLGRQSLFGFAIYCWIVGILLLILFTTTSIGTQVPS